MNQLKKGGKYIIEWKSRGRGKIKDELDLKFLSKILMKEKRISKAKTKMIWQKIAVVKVPKFTSELKDGFQKYREAIKRSEKLDEEILKIDRAIDRLVYDLYGLTEDDIMIMEKSAKEENFEEIYSKLPSKDEAIKLTEGVKVWS